jgi:elongation factor Ts
MDKAVEYLREKGLAKAAKKASRIAAEGICETTVSADGKVAAIVEVNSETDFVAKNDKFRGYVKTVVEQAANSTAADIDAFLAETWAADPSKTVAEELAAQIAVIGENMKIRRFERLEGDLVSYTHGGGSAACVALFETENADSADFQDLGKNICMQVVAMTPDYLCPEEVPAEVVESEKNILIAQIKNDPKSANKPDQVIEKMVMGKINKYYQENCLLKQAYVKDNKMSVEQYINQSAKDFGFAIKLVKFVTYEKGEGLEKRQDDFASEVASMTK